MSEVDVAQRPKDGREHRHEQKDLEEDEPNASAQCVHAVHDGFGEPLMIDPGTIAREGILIGDMDGAGRNDVLSKTHMTKQVGVGASVGEDGEHQARE